MSNVPITVTFDKSSAGLVLEAFQGTFETLECTGCGEKVTPSTLGAICMIDGKPTIWHNSLMCIMAFSTARQKAGHSFEEQP